MYKKKFVIFFSKWRLYTMTAEESLNMRCSAVGSTTAVILVVKKNLSYLCWINLITYVTYHIFKYWIFINFYKFEVDVRIVHKKWSKTGYKSDNFYDIKKPVRILLDNLITVCKRSVQNFRSIAWKLFDSCCQPIWKTRFWEKHVIASIL